MAKIDIGKTATIMIHEVSAGIWGKNLTIQNEAVEIKRLNDLLFATLDKNTKKKANYWRNLVDKNKNTDLFLNANQAKRHGLATHIGIPHIETEIVVKKTLCVN